MTWTSAIVVFVIIWWVVLFAMLPIGISDHADSVEEGHAHGAPNRPRILFKFAITTAITVVLWAIAYYVIESGMISFREG